jgi:hypothetical protein
MLNCCLAAHLNRTLLFRYAKTIFCDNYTSAEIKIIPRQRSLALRNNDRSDKA